MNLIKIDPELSRLWPSFSETPIGILMDYSAEQVVVTEEEEFSFREHPTEEELETTAEKLGKLFNGLFEETRRIKTEISALESSEESSDEEEENIHSALRNKHIRLLEIDRWSIFVTTLIQDSVQRYERKHENTPALTNYYRYRISQMEMSHLTARQAIERAHSSEVYRLHAANDSLQSRVLSLEAMVGSKLPREEREYQRKIIGLEDQVRRLSVEQKEYIENLEWAEGEIAARDKRIRELQARVERSSNANAEKTEKEMAALQDQNAFLLQEVRVRDEIIKNLERVIDTEFTDFDNGPLEASGHKS